MPHTRFLFFLPLFDCLHGSNKPNGVGIVKLMGRSAGFIAAHAVMASSDVDLCLVPEVPTVLEGELGCLPHIRRRVKEQGYAVIVVAEGAGEDVLGVSAETDASGNKKLPAIGAFMKQQVEDHFKKEGDVATVKCKWRKKAVLQMRFFNYSYQLE